MSRRTTLLNLRFGLDVASEKVLGVGQELCFNLFLFVVHGGGAKNKQFWKGARQTTHGETARVRDSVAVHVLFCNDSFEGEEKKKKKKKED